MRAVLLIASTLTVVMAVTAAAPAQSLKVTGASLKATEGAPLTATAGTVDVSCQSIGSATIAWGDGATSPADGKAVTLTDDPNSSGVCDIGGTHTYGEEGAYGTTVGVFIAAIGTTNGTGSAAVADAPLTVAVPGISATAGAAFSGTVATFGDAGGLEAASTYSATIDWGDGTSSAGTVTPGAVAGSHTYASPGTFTVTVTVVDEGGASATAAAAAAVDALHACTPPGTAVGPALPPSGATPNERFVTGVYRDLLGRQPAPGELTYFAHALGIGMTRTAVALALGTSAEFRARLVGSFYEAYMGRSPDASGLNALTGLLSAGHSDEDVASQLLGSPEYFTGHTDGTNAGFVDSLYCDVLGRHADAPALQTFQQALGAGQTRAQVALAVLDSAESRQGLVGGWYRRYLRRQPDSQGVAALVAQLSGASSDEQVLAELLGSAEYFDARNPATSGIGQVVFTGGLLHITLRRPGTVTITVLRVLAGKASTVPSPAVPRVRRVRVISLRRHKTGTLRVHPPAKLRSGRYVLMVRLRSRGGKLIGVGDAITYRVRS